MKALYFNDNVEGWLDVCGCEEGTANPTHLVCLGLNPGTIGIRLPMRFQITTTQFSQWRHAS